MDYNITFKNRCNKYKYATETYPHVLNNEYINVIKACELQPNDVLLNIPAACVPLKKYIPLNINYLEYETNLEFAKLMGIAHTNITHIPESDKSVDVIVSVASLHHTNMDERRQFYKEACRILKPNGRLIIADVAHGSNQAYWLNTFVNKYNSNGHNGIFWSMEDVKLLNECNFITNVYDKYYYWDFNSEYETIDFCRNIFGLDLADNNTIKKGITTYLKPFNYGITNITTDNLQINNHLEHNLQPIPTPNIRIPWHLMYFISTISPSYTQDLEEKPDGLDLV